MQAIAREKENASAKAAPEQNEIDIDTLSPLEILRNLFTKAIGEAYPSIPQSLVCVANSQFSDYQCNSAMAICGTLKSQGYHYSNTCALHHFGANLEPKIIALQVKKYRLKLLPKTF